MNIFTILISIISTQELAYSEKTTLTLRAAIIQAIEKNPELGVHSARSNAEHSAIRAQYWLDNPKLGIMNENNMNFMQQQMGPMTSWVISQEIKFPMKYILLGSAQKSRAAGSTELLEAKKLEIRQKLITNYYNLYTTDRIIELLSSQRETLREVARAAELRHATGAVPQQDEMKAHVEQTRIENELILAQEERETTESRLNSILAQDVFTEIKISNQDTLIPELNVDLEDIPKHANTHSREIKYEHFLVEEATSRKTLAHLSYAPNLMITYQRAFSNSLENAYSFGIELSIPLWFFTNQTSEIRQASARQIESEKNLEVASRELNSEIRSLIIKIRSRGDLLKIFQTSLIPQATSTMNSSRAAYLAGRTSFFEFLDSERLLYETRISYYRNLGQYVEILTKLEWKAGISLSTLPFEGNL